jgi:hypothetical protein
LYILLVLDGKDLIQVNATTIAGLLILFTLTTIGSASQNTQPPSVTKSLRVSGHNTTVQFTIFPSTGEMGRTYLNKTVLALRTIVVTVAVSSIAFFAYSTVILISDSIYVIKKDKNKAGSTEEIEQATQIDQINSYKLFKRALKATRRGFKYLAGSAVVSVCAFGITYLLELLH